MKPATRILTVATLIVACQAAIFAGEQPAPTAHATAKPFIPIREVMLYCPNSDIWNAMAPELKQKYFMCYWPDDRIRRHVEMLHAFGFNALQVSVVGQMPRNAGTTMDEWVHRVNVMIDAGRELGMSNTLFVWGNAISSLDPKAADPHPIHDWHKPSGREALEREWERSARVIGAKVDRVVTHWCDPGGATKGCPDCTIHTAVEMHNAIMATFRGVNPRIDGYFSNWMLYPGNKSYGNGWPGYDGVKSVVGDPAFDRASGLAIGINNYGSDGVHVNRAGKLNPADLKAVTDAGRRAAVWAWYTTDIEIQPSLHVHTKLLQNYFRGLPPETRDAVAWHTVEDCSSGLNMHNLYVACQLMQDPTLDAQALLRDYAEGFFGKAAAPALVRALEAVEHARCRSLRYRLKVSDPNEALHKEELSTDKLPADWADRGLALTAASLEELQGLTLPDGHQAAWPVTLSPQEFLPELVAHLKAIRQMLTFLKAAKSVRSQEDVERLPTVEYDLAHTAGLEASAYRQILGDLKRKYGKAQP
jgi:hypothetical protein